MVKSTIYTNYNTDYKLQITDEVFVIGISYKVNKNNKIKHLKVVFTTLRLLELAMKNKLIASDGTYKLELNFLNNIYNVK